MGMDVSGINPTTEAGEYFRANVWGWRPIESMLRLIEFVAQHVADEQQLVGDVREAVTVDWSRAAQAFTITEGGVEFPDSHPVYFPVDQFASLGYNDGAGTRTALATRNLAEAFNTLVNGIESRDAGILKMLRDMQLDVVDIHGQMAVAFRIPAVPEPYEMLVDITGAFRKRGEIPLDDLHSAYCTTLSHLREWVEFLQGAGDGFSIH